MRLLDLCDSPVDIVQGLLTEDVAIKGSIPSLPQLGLRGCRKHSSLSLAKSSALALCPTERQFYTPILGAEASGKRAVSRPGQPDSILFHAPVALYIFRIPGHMRDEGERQDRGRVSPATTPERTERALHAVIALSAPPYSRFA